MQTALTHGTAVADVHAMSSKISKHPARYFAEPNIPDITCLRTASSISSVDWSCYSPVSLRACCGKLLAPLQPFTREQHFASWRSSCWVPAASVRLLQRLHLGQTEEPSTMNTLNERAFAALNAGTDTLASVTHLAMLFADYAIWLVPLALLSCWLWGKDENRRAAVETTLAGFLALWIAQVIALSIYHPRPFAVGLGVQLIPHIPDSSFPSDHGTLLAAVAAGFLLHRSTRLLGLAFAVLWLPVAWSRIYLGVHFPADMIGGFVVGLCSAVGVRRFGDSVAIMVLRVLGGVHRYLLSPPIRRGWVRP